MMPFCFSTGLPGPFRYSHRIGGSRRGSAGSRFESIWYWLFGIWALEAAIWIMIGLVVGIAALVSMGVDTYRKRHPSPGMEHASRHVTKS